MQLSQLRAFCAVAHTGSINAAAKALNRVPSSLSVRIRQLEEDLGCQLFLREHQRLRLSPDGRRLLEHARRILDLSDSTRAMMRNEESGGRLVVGALDVVLVAFMPCLIGRFRQRHRAIELDIRSEASEALVQQVSDGVLDLALSDGPVRSQTLESSLAFVDEMVLVTELDHPPITSPRDLRCAELYGFRHDCSKSSPTTPCSPASAQAWVPPGCCAPCLRRYLATTRSARIRCATMAPPRSISSGTAAISRPTRNA